MEEVSGGSFAVGKRADLHGVCVGDELEDRRSLVGARPLGRVGGRAREALGDERAARGAVAQEPLGSVDDHHGVAALDDW